MKKIFTIIGLLSISLTASAATIEQAMDSLTGRQASIPAAPVDNRSFAQLLADGKRLVEQAADLTIKAMEYNSFDRADPAGGGPTIRVRHLNAALHKVDDAIVNARIAQLKARNSNTPSGNGDSVAASEAGMDVSKYEVFRKALQEKYDEASLF